MELILTNLILIVTLFNYVELRLYHVNDTEDCKYCTLHYYHHGRCFKKSQWCDSSINCIDKTDEKFCNAVFPNCGTLHEGCFSGKCIPKSWFCDGQVDCKDGSDEECVKGKSLQVITGPAKINLRKWVLNQRSSGWGWEKDTARAIVAMHLMNTSEFSSGNLVSELAAKELEAQLSFALFRNQSIPIGEGELALFLHAMLATCLNSRTFHGLNVISALEEMISKLEFVKPITLLALCNAGHPISQKYVNKLKDVILKPNEPVWIDTKAIATMALLCASKQTNHQGLNGTLRSVIHGLKQLQLPDGSFGDVRTSALIMQVMISNSETNDLNFLKALYYLTNQHRNDSSGMLTNYLIMPVLSRRSLLNLGEVNCSYKVTKNLRNLTLREILEQKRDERIHVQYSIKIGDQEDVSYSYTLRVPVNTTFFDVMRLASDLDKRYAFQWTRHRDRKYVSSLFSIDNDPELRKYWTLYKMTSDGDTRFITEDIDDIYPQESEHYIFWYKTVHEYDTKDLDIK